MTDDEITELRAAERRVTAARAEHEAAQAARNDLMRRLYARGGRGYGPTAIARALDMNRVTVARIVGATHPR